MKKLESVGYRVALFAWGLSYV